MRTLYIECSMGAAGDMLTAALLELFEDKEKVVDELNSLGIPKVRFESSVMSKCGINGTHMTVTVDGEEEDESMHDHDHEHEHEHHHEEEEHHRHHEHPHHPDHHYHDTGYAHHHTHSHSSLHDIEHIVRDHLGLCNNVTQDIMSIYGLIAEAESVAHGKPVDEIHFHEVGTMDAVADITACCYLIDKLKVDKIVASPVCVGSGRVKCAHGILPVPAPATAYILKDVPSYAGDIRGELCTPTGAAILKHFVSKFGSQPVMKVDKIGYGMGKKDFEAANCVRVFLGETSDISEQIFEINFNVDDMTGEEIGFATEKIFEAGARDCFTTPVYMKKNRPGVLVTIICDGGHKENIINAVFKHTTTIGIREKVVQRYVLDRKNVKLLTSYGEVNAKVSTGYGVTKTKVEYDDISKICNDKDISVYNFKEEM